MKQQQDKRQPVSTMYFDEIKSLEEIKNEMFFKQSKRNPDGSVSLDNFNELRPPQDFKDLSLLLRRGK